ncbi:MAG: NAD(P)-binding domain-containing protein [Cyanobacteria bacterium P01_D01_bin.14]
MKIAILGYGRVGQTFASLFSRAGHAVVIGTRAGSSRSIPYPALGFREAAAAAEAVAIAIPFSACLTVMPALVDVTQGKLVIDSANPLYPDWSPLLLGQENSAAEEIARLLPGAHVVKAFNTIFADAMVKPVRQGIAISAFIAGDDDSAKHTVMTLAQDIGYAPVNVGPLRSARYLEGLAHLNIQIAFSQDTGTSAAFAYLVA